jgi:hypothetical protein
MEAAAPGRVSGFRTWTRATLTGLAAGAVVGAAALGVAYGLGIVRLARTFDAGAGDQWNAQLAWLSWFAMLAAIAGAATADRAARRCGHTPGVGTRILLALCGGIGAGAVVPLSMQPARTAQLAQSGDPALMVGLAGGLGAVAGVLIAVAALSLRPLAWHVAAVAAVVWLAGLAAVAGRLDPADPVPAARLGVPQWTAQPHEYVDMLSMPVLTWLLALLVAAVARARRQPAPVIAISGTAGAAPLALAYLIAGPGSNGETGDQLAPYLGALIAVPAGLLGSLLVALLPRRDRERTGGHRGATAGAGAAVAPPAAPPLAPPLAPLLAPPVGPPAAPLVGPPAAPLVGPPAAPLVGPPVAQGGRQRSAAGVAGVAAVPRREDHGVGGPLPRRTPGPRFPAGT